MNKPLNILIVDDDPMMANTMADILNMSGYRVTACHSAEEALDTARKIELDVVISDIRMPGMNGVELFNALQSVQPNLPVILMTAYAAEELIRQGMAEGVIGTLDKPVDIHRLLSLLNTLQEFQTIAVVDDDPNFCKTLADILVEKGFQVKQITDPHIDIQPVTDEAQVIIIDLLLNSITGLEILQEIRKRRPIVPVIMITGFRQEMLDTIEKAREMNAETLYKPLSLPDLLKVLDDIRDDHLRDALNGRE